MKISRITLHRPFALYQWAHKKGLIYSFLNVPARVKEEMLAFQVCLDQKEVKVIKENEDSEEKED